ncbi:hypothetical protein M3Y97_00105600 [Aphelenchoides bicaudatus]|nr:hypothetical protein M3Y97_00105600 [Aphelenchoides bicaudatus]
MGALTSSCQSEEAREQIAKSRAIEKQINQDKRTSSSIIKLLLLGEFCYYLGHLEYYLLRDL